MIHAEHAQQQIGEIGPTSQDFLIQLTVPALATGVIFVTIFLHPSHSPSTYLQTG